jgi:hypothetical protein
VLPLQLGLWFPQEAEAMARCIVLAQALGCLFLARVLHGQAAPYADSFAGADIGAKANAAFASCQQMPGLCLVQLEPNRAYTFSTPIRFPETSATLDCSGSILHFEGTGDAILIPPGPPQPPFLSGGIQNCTLLGNASPKANGIHQQSRLGFLYDRVAVRDFTGVEAAAVWWENVSGGPGKPGWNEQDVVRKMDLGNSTRLFRMTRSSGTDSFMYNRFEDMHLDVMDGQTGISIEGSGVPGSLSLIHDEISTRANVNAASKGATVIAVTRGGRIERSRLTLLAEQTSGTAASYGLYVDTGSSVYTSGTYSVANLKTFIGARSSLVMIPTLNPSTGSVHFEPAQDVIQQRHCKFDLGPLNATFWLASYGGTEVNCNFEVMARNTDDANPDVNVQGKGAPPVNVLYADGKTKSVGIGPGFSNQSLPSATLAVNGTTQLGARGTPISKLAKAEARFSPAAVPAGTCVAQMFAVPGIEADDIVLAVNKASQQEGLALGGFSAAAGQLMVNFCNLTNRPLIPSANELYRIALMR